MIMSSLSETQFLHLRAVMSMSGWAVYEVPKTVHGSKSGSISLIPFLGWEKGNPHFLLLILGVLSVPNDLLCT